MRQVDDLDILQWTCHPAALLVASDDKHTANPEYLKLPEMSVPRNLRSDP